MTADDRKLEGADFKKGRAESEWQNHDLRPGKKLAKQPLNDAASSERFSFSKFTLIGVSLFPLAILFSIIFISGSPRLMLGTFTICLLIVLLGVVIDVLRWRDYTEWGALGAIIAYIGLVVAFGMLIVFMVSDPWAESIALTGAESVLYPVVVLLGAVIILIGFTSRATEFDRKIEAQLARSWHAIRTFDVRLFISSTLRLMGALAVGMILYLWRGLITLKSRIIVFGKLVQRTISSLLASAWIFLTETFPRTLRRTMVATWRNFHWIGLITLILYLAIFDLLIASGSEETYLKTELFIVVGFFFSLGVIYPHREQLVQAVQRVQDYSWEKMYSVNLAVRSLGATRRKMLCRNCDAEIPLSSTACPTCSNGVEKCNICRLPLKGGEPITNCEACERAFHQNHWEQWIKRGSSCPVCRGEGLPPVEEKPVKIPTAEISEALSSKPTDIPEIHGRNKEIVQLYDQGWNLSALAARFDMSSTAIWMILKRQDRQPARPSQDLSSLDESSAESTDTISPEKPVNEIETTIQKEIPPKEPSESQLSKCPSCGGENQRLAKYCRHCGVDLQELAVDQEQVVAEPTIASEAHSSIIETAAAIYNHLSNSPRDFPTAFSFIVKGLWQLVAQLPDSPEKKKLYSQGKELRNFFNQLRKGLITLQEFGEK
ncbi:MAG: hypothetical protein ACXAB4_12880, partial [Candidatus Hodarchaeales archaeon]